MGGTLTGTITSGSTALSQNGPWSNDNKAALLISQSSRTEASAPDSVYYHTKDTQ